MTKGAGSGEPSLVENLATLSVENLRAEVECPICQKIPRQGPVYQCKFGHLICNECYPKCKSCPVCRSFLGLDRIRSILADKILDLIPKPCENYDAGCEVELHEPQLRGHEAVCPHRMVCCVDIACEAMIPFSSLLKHIQDPKFHHKQDFRHNPNHHFESHLIVTADNFEQESMWVSDHLIRSGYHFFRESYRGRDGMWQIWVLMAGNSDEAKRFTATIEIFTEDEKLSFTGPVNALSSKKHEFMHQCSGIPITDRIAKRFLRDQKLHYKVTIHDKSVEAIHAKVKVEREIKTIGPPVAKGNNASDILEDLISDTGTKEPLVEDESNSESALSPQTGAN